MLGPFFVVLSRCCAIIKKELIRKCSFGNGRVNQCIVNKNVFNRVLANNKMIGFNIILYWPIETIKIKFGPYNSEQGLVLVVFRV